jgi:hypothetical protein
LKGRGFSRAALRSKGLSGFIPKGNLFSTACIPSAAKQAAEKLCFSKRPKNKSRHKARGAIRGGHLMVFYHPIFDLSLYFWSFSAVCKAASSSDAPAARLKPCPSRALQR